MALWADLWRDVPVDARSVSLALCLLTAVGAGFVVVLFESPVRSTAALVTAFIAVASAAAVLGAPLLPSFLLWIGVGAVAVFLLATVLLLNLTVDERGRRRLRVRPAFALLAIALLGAPLLAAAVLPARDAAVASQPLTAAIVAHAVLVDHGAATGTVACALACALVGGLALVRRRA